jgi:hypothetical protein
MRKLTARLPALAITSLLIAFVGLRFLSNGLAASQVDQDVTVYIPVVHIRSFQPTSDLRIVHLGLFQSVQNANNEIPLVAGKPAILRVFAQDLNHGGDLAQASVTVRAYRGGESIGSISSTPQPVPNQPETDDLHSTFNFELPETWLDGQLKLVATIDETDAVTELNETNNSAEDLFTFQTVAPLDLTIVPIVYTDTRSGIIYQPDLTDPVSEWLQTAYPLSKIKVTMHAPYAFSGDLSQPESWQLLLERLTALWAVEAGFGSPHLYLGLIPAHGPDGSWFQSGISGLGWLGYRVSLAVDFGEGTEMVAAHEIGHNFGRRHAPCGNPANIDSQYPYPDGSIGVYGVDTHDAELLDPDHARDFMSYCGPEWVSDYTYEALFQDQLIRSSRIGDQGSGYLLRARMVDGNDISLLPTYQYEGLFFPTGSDSPYQAQIIDADGAIVATHHMAYLEAEERGVRAKILVAHLAEPPKPGQFVRFSMGNQVLDTEQIAPIGRAGNDDLRLKVDPNPSGKITLRWNESNTPALIRFLPEGSDRWVVLAVDQTGGSLNFDARQLPAARGFFDVTLSEGGGSASGPLK